MENQDKKEQDAVFTTIVGGRPPGCGTSVGNIPRGIEVMIKKASVDPEFRKLLIGKKAEAANSIDLQLDKTETAIINSIPASQLSAIVAGTTLPQEHHQVFLGKAAALMLAALGVVAITGCDAYLTKGSRPVPKKNPIPIEKVTKPNDPQPAAVKPEKPASDYSYTSRGIRPDRPIAVKPENIENTNTVKPQIAPSVTPPEERNRRMTKGMRADRPPKK